MGDRTSLAYDWCTVPATYTITSSQEYITASPGWEPVTNIGVASESDLDELKERMNKLEERLRELELEILMK